MLSNAKRSSLHLFPTRRTSSYRCLADSTTSLNDAIPLVDLPLARSNSETIARPPPPYTETTTSSPYAAPASTPRRVYRYVSHGIGGAGNFRRVLTSLRGDGAASTSDPSFARKTKGRRGGICACSRCFKADTA